MNGKADPSENKVRRITGSDLTRAVDGLKAREHDMALRKAIFRAGNATRRAKALGLANALDRRATSADIDAAAALATAAPTSLEFRNSELEPERFVTAARVSRSFNRARIETLIETLEGLSAKRTSLPGSVRRKKVLGAFLSLPGIRHFLLFAWNGVTFDSRRLAGLSAEALRTLL